MENCNMKRGFFFLRDCDYPAHQSCSSCGKSFCNEHLRLKPGISAPFCLDCLGKTMQQSIQGKDKGVSTRDNYDDYYYDTAWCYGYRSNYYSSGSYKPWYFGSVNADDSDFNDSDIRVFDAASESDDPDAEAFDPEANVFDS
ncbi:MAG: hypothetical protein CVV41_15745 [Candidatus Riflebacteria bacterium HGW-Riflebacteria-1]|jgi:hypothetical protein|nr:MAG: hypothetical protein CVV41_15745 [Candidatus Riflebacteria bacterium HGW-Riflebacteria-1]